MKGRGYWPPQTGAEAFAWAAVLGVVSVVWPVVVVTALILPFYRDPEWDWPVRLVFVVLDGMASTVCAIPFTGLGLLIFGVPVALLLKRHLVGSRWLIAPVLAWAALSSMSFFYLLERLWNPGHYFDMDALIGLLVGIPAALWAWFLYRRVLIRRAAEAEA